MKVCEAVIGRQVLHMDKAGVKQLLGGRGEQIPWNLNLTQIIQVEPGTEAQGLHRDGGYLQFNFDNQLEHQISTIWALHDFTEEVGATHAIAGSHRWPRTRTPLPAETFQAEMPAGSVIIYTGHTYHGAGTNSSPVPRRGLNIDYIAGFVCEEEFQVLGNPPEVARHFPRYMQKLCGYEIGAGALNYYGDFQHPIESFTCRPIDWARHGNAAAATAAAKAGPKL
jgi:ectoine hydroxylase-related dioxygenase (phytanoyl-CoA dioxygenase family)